MLDTIIAPKTRWRMLREAKAYFANYSRPASRSKKVLIWAQGRTGSTVLENLIASTGNFIEKGELLSGGYENLRVLAPAKYMEGESRFEPNTNFICHVKIYHLAEERVREGGEPVDPGAFLRSLRDDGWQIIYLSRRDKFLHFLSGQVAKARGSYYKYSNEAETFQVTIEKEELEAGLKKRLNWDRQETKALEGIDYLPVVYEDDLSSPEAQKETVRRILAFLDLPYREPETKLRKVNNRSTREVVANYDEVLGWLKEMGIEHPV